MPATSSADIFDPRFMGERHRLLTHNGRVNQAPAAPSKQRTRRRKWLRRIGKSLLLFVIVVTSASVLFNSLTTPPKSLKATSGEDIQLPQGRLHYEPWGEKGPAIVLVHGFAESTLAWSLVGPQLAKKYRVYAIDMPGFGYSEYTGDYTVEDEARAVRQFIEAKHLNKPIIAGHSLGAAVVGKVALDAPNEISGMIFVDGDALPFSSSGRSWFVNALTATPYFTSGYRIATRWQWADKKVFKSACGSTCEGMSDDFVRQWMRPMKSREAERGLVDMAKAPMLALTPEEVRRISVPRGIIWGAEDASSGGSLEGAKKNLKNPPTQVIQGAAHMPMIARPDVFVAAFEQIVQQLGQ